MIILSIMLLVACTTRATVTDTSPVLDTEDPKPEGPCFPVFGVDCDCDPNCITQEQLDAIDTGSVCEIDCFGDVDWSCDLVDAVCVVVEP